MRGWLVAGLVLPLLLSLHRIVDAKEQKTRNVVVTADEEKVRDRLGFEAIAELHREMDDDHSGSIDRAESTGFMQEDMNIRSSDRTRREKAFHHDDDAISVDDLWEAWFESEERAWDTDQVVNWLITSVNLPQYAEQARRNKIDGRSLPRLAVHNSSFINVLGVKNSVHRQKLRLSALDVVLFGVRVDSSARLKDLALGLLLVLLSSVVLLYVRQKRRAAAESAELTNQLHQLKSMESEFEESQKRFAEERRQRLESTTEGSREVQDLRQRLHEYEKRLEEGDSQSVYSNGMPLALQPLLRKACEAELSQMDRLRAECVSEMREAIDLVDKLKKKQSSVINSIKLATGASSGSDQLDSRIFALKARMDKIHAQMNEVQERWLQIESLCGFEILYPNETVMSGRAPATNSTFYRTPSDGERVAPISSGSIRPPASLPGSSSSSDGCSSTTGSQRSLTALVNNNNGVIKKESRANGGSSLVARHASPAFRRRDEPSPQVLVEPLTHPIVAASPPPAMTTMTTASTPSSSASSTSSSPRTANGTLPLSEKDDPVKRRKKQSKILQLFKSSK